MRAEVQSPDDNRSSWFPGGSTERRRESASMPVLVCACALGEFRVRRVCGSAVGLIIVAGHRLQEIADSRAVGVVRLVLYWANLN